MNFSKEHFMSIVEDTNYLNNYNKHSLNQFLMRRIKVFPSAERSLYERAIRLFGGDSLYIEEDMPSQGSCSLWCTNPSGLSDFWNIVDELRTW